MNRWLRYMLLGIAIVTVIVGTGLAYIYLADFPHYDTSVPSITIASTPERVDRGRKLAMMLCVECHQNPETKQITGRPMYDLPKEFGTVYTKNITQHPTKGIGSWSDGELLFILRTGIHPKTSRIVPLYMIRLPRMADEDIASIIAWLRSSDPIVQPLNVENRVSEPSFLTKFLMRFVIHPFPLPQEKILVPDSSNKTALGKYLVENLGCNDCHAADVTKVNPLEIEKSAGFLGGGSNWTDVNRKVLYSTNITFDKETGIGSWSDGDFRRAIHDGIRPDGTPLRYPMERKPLLTNTEIDAIYAYLQTVPHIHNPRKPPEEYALAANASEGMKIYYKYGCQTCHGETGLGIGDLRQADKKYSDDETLIQVIKRPSTYFPETVMIQWDGIIKEEEYKPLVGYVRELGRNAAQRAAPQEK